MRPYRPRTICFHDVYEHGGWRIKRFTISFDGSAVHWDSFAPGLLMARAALPQPPQAEGRPGVGFAIAHHGRTADFVVLGWWDNENELPLRVFVRPPGESWRVAGPSESVCVWDLEVVWAERQAYVDTMLTQSGTAEDYLARHGGWAEDEVMM
jgi:hypothetical protein